MSTETPESIYRRIEIEGTALGDEVVFFDDRVGKYFATGTVGADIWKLLERPATLDAIVAALVHLYEVDEATCRVETKVFLDRLVSIGLATVE
jgi:hypothetical protein